MIIVVFRKDSLNEINIHVVLNFKCFFLFLLDCD